MTDIGHDMHRMFCERLRKLIEDCGDTSNRAGMDDEDISRMLVTGLLAEVVIGTMMLDLDETEFVRACTYARRQLVKIVKVQVPPGMHLFTDANGPGE